MAGVSQGPTPWWQTTPNMAAKANNLGKSAPPGYTYDLTQMKYVPTATSAATQLADKQKNDFYKDTLFQQGLNDHATAKLAFENAEKNKNALNNQLTGALTGLQGLLTSSFSNTPSVPTSPVSNGPSGNPIPGIEYRGNTDTSQIDAALKSSQEAAFGNAKAKAGALGRSAISSTASELAGRGLSTGGGAFARRIADRVASATNPLSDINVAQLGENANNARKNVDTATHAADVAYQGGITQRGQDISQHESEQNRKAEMANQNANRAIEAARMKQQSQLQVATLLQNALTSLQRLY